MFPNFLHFHAAWQGRQDALQWFPAELHDLTPPDVAMVGSKFDGDDVGRSYAVGPAPHEG